MLATLGCTAGSVDDGKSTLIGRLLYDSKTLFIDQLAAVERVSRERGHDYTDLALLTDGLRAEREQGITIDVAYRYFATPKRASSSSRTPRATSSTRGTWSPAPRRPTSRSLLLDARQGITEQSRRHAFLATLLGVPHLVLCVNKMDLVDWSEEAFEAIREEFTEFASRLRVRDLTFIPVSALHGDNVVSHRRTCPGTTACRCSPPRAAVRRQRPQPRRRPLPGPVRHPAAVAHGRRLPRLRGHGGLGRAQARRPGAGPAERARDDDRQRSRRPTARSTRRSRRWP